MKTAELRELADDELLARLEAQKEELFNLRFQLATRQLKNYRGLPTARKRIARVLTVMDERKTEAANG